MQGGFKDCPGKGNWLTSILIGLNRSLNLQNAQPNFFSAI